MPYRQNDIRLKYEKLNIESDAKDPEGKADVYAKFVFSNEGNTVNIKMDFPFGMSRAEGGIVPFPQNISVKVDNKTIKVERIKTETSNYDP